ncbi:Uncharacterized protein TPAR_00516 [Tolypocladium paradoxum]|uniref:Nuclear protein Qri2/Nse4 n=1 Tax=Tolypocladium paradoxum TaxID=94208 RepID=A0A2S4LA26_9HYPO|nr:Uncharacterized protein TPAR_00516 [Tolypocladium paradoxum]
MPRLSRTRLQSVKHGYIKHPSRASPSYRRVADNCACAPESGEARISRRGLLASRCCVIDGSRSKLSGIKACAASPSTPLRLPLRQRHRTRPVEDTKTRAFSSSPATAATMSAKLIPSNPADLMVIRNVTPSIATFSVPFLRYGRIKIGGRGTLVKLTSGTLAAFSPVALTEATKAKVAEMGGKVGYIVALDIEHHIFISEWAKEYPGAKIIGPEGLQEKRDKQQKDDTKIGNDKVDVVFTKANKREVRIGDEFDADFDYEYVDGHANLELVFLYRPERVLIEADLMFNLPAVEQYSRVPEADRKGGIADRLFQHVQSTAGDATWMKRFNWYLGSKDRASVNESLKAIAAWDFVTLIPCHGDVLEGNGKEVFNKVFKWHLEAKK